MPLSDVLWDLASLALGYLIGSIPFGLLLTRLAGLGDLRAIGSGNIGATNVLRTGSRALAAATLAGDLLKGTFAVVLVGAVLGRDFALVAGLGAFLGHLFPVWLKFKGGKGVATYLGVLLGLVWPAAIGFAVIWLICAALTRLSSLSALIASFAAPFLVFAFSDTYEARLFVVLTILLWAKHQENLKRLLAGTEPRLGARR